MTDKQKLFLIALFTGIITATIIGFTFAYWTWTAPSASQTAIDFTVGSGFSCSADGGGNITSSSITLAPADCANSTYAIKRAIKVSTTQDTGKTVYLDINLKVNSIGSGLSGTSNFRYALTKGANSCNSGVIATGNFSGAMTNTEKKLLKEWQYTTSTTDDTYYLWIWLDREETSTSTQNQSFNMTLSGSCTDEAPEALTTSWGASVDRTTKVDYSKTSTLDETNGLFLYRPSAGDTYPLYYYRGNVTNNNVLFGGFCWKIVRTTSTGGTKLIYNGLPSNGECTNTTGTDTQLASTSKFNNSYNSPAYVGYMYGAAYMVTSKKGSSLPSTSYKYGNSVSWNGSTYTLTNTIDSTGTWSTDYNTLNINHYTCFNTTGVCTSVYYINYTDSTRVYYMTLTGGKKIEEALDEMLTSSTNTTDSTMKTTLDTWYTTNLSSYANYLEDTVWCNDRKIYQLGGFNPNGGSTTGSDYYLYYGARERMFSVNFPNMECMSKNDSFTVSNVNGNGKLTNPIGLLTADEVNIAGGREGLTNDSYYLYTNQDYWALSPYSFSNVNASEYDVYSTGSFNGPSVDFAFGVRPAVSLKPGATWSGEGTSSNPYQVSLS